MVNELREIMLRGGYFACGAMASVTSLLAVYEFANENYLAGLAFSVNTWNLMLGSDRILKDIVASRKSNETRLEEFV